MNTEVEAFIAEVRSRPEFVAAASENPAWTEQLDGIERILRLIYQDGGRSAPALEAFDEIRTTVSDATLTLKQRLLQVSCVLSKYRETIDGVQQ